MKNKPYAVLTGDVVKSSGVPVKKWLTALKIALNTFGRNLDEWEIFRGDSFQLMLDQPQRSLFAALVIKASLKQIDENLDARIAIGFGKVNYLADQISQSNGPAFIRADMLYEKLGKKAFAVEYSENLSIMVDMAQLAINNWTSLEAETFLAKLKQPAISQVQLAAVLNTTQSRVSERLKRSGYEEIQQFAAYFESNFRDKNT